MSNNWTKILTVACPHCNVQVGKNCVDEYGEILEMFPGHTSRLIFTEKVSRF